MNSKVLSYEAIGHYVGLLASLFGLGLAIFKRDLLPEKFFYDEIRIIQFVEQPSLVFQDGSYAGTTAVYLLLGGYWISTGLMSAITYLLFVVLVEKHFPLRSASSRVGTTLLYGSTVCLGAIYVAGYTKEAVLVLLMLLYPSNKRGLRVEILWLTLAALYAFSVRDYWWIVLAIYVFFRVSSLRCSPLKVFLLSAPVLLLFMAIAFRTLLDVDLHYFRTSVVAGLSIQPESAIINPLPSGSLLNEWINALWSLVVLLIPLPLLGFGLVQLPAFLYITALWIGMLLPSPRTSSTYQTRVRQYCLAFAYVITLSLFEPDYGSYLRHLVAVAPVFLPLLLHLAGAKRATERRPCSNRSLAINEGKQWN